MMTVEELIRNETISYVVFKITPHTSNLNSTTRKLQNSLYELFNYRYPKYPWNRIKGISSLTKDNLYVTIKPNPKIWWFIRMVCEKKVSKLGTEETIPKIEFYIAVPEDFRNSFQVKFLNHEQWRKATIEEIPYMLSFEDEENLDLYDLRYTRSDMFSLKTDYTQQTSPIRDIMSVSKDLSEGEEIFFFIQLETVPRKKWKKLSDYAWSVWNKGGVPSRPGFNPSNIKSGIANAASVTFGEVKQVLDETLYSFGKTFMYYEDEKPVKQKKEVINFQRDEILVNGKLSEATNKKRNMAVFKTDIMFTVSSKDKVKREMLARSMVSAFADMNGDNTLREVKLVFNTKKDLEFIKQMNMDSAFSNLMSVDEVGKLMQLPTAELQREFAESLTVNNRVEIDLAKELLDPKGILVGTSTLRGNTFPIHIQTKNRDFTATARGIIGSPRMGKDQAAINLIVEAKRNHNYGAIILDIINENNGHRGMSDAIRDHLEPEDIVDINIMDSENPIYLGLEPIIKLIKDSRIASDRIAEELCYFLLSDGDEDKLRTVEYLREAAKLTDSDVLAIKHMFTSDSYRAKVIKEKRKIFDVDIWDDYNNLSDGQKQSIYTPVLRRIGQILSSEFLKPIFCQRPNPTLDLFNFIKEGKVIIFRMKSGLMSQRVIEILSYWIVLVTFLIKLAQDGDTEKSNGTFLVLNEPHQYLTDNLAHFVERILAEGPKYRLIPVLIFHHFKQFKKFPGFVEMLKSASLNWHIFKNTNEDVYKELFNAYLSRTFETPQQAFEATRKYQYIGVFLNSDGVYYDPFVADALPLVSDRYKTLNNSHLTLQHSKKFGRPIEEVLEEIRLRNKEAQKPLKNPDKKTDNHNK